HTGHHCLTAELALGADLASDTRDLSREAVELIDHRIDGVLQRENLALHIDGDLARKVSPSDSGRYFRDVTDLVGQVRPHEVHAIGEVLPCAGDTGYRRLAAKLCFCPNFARDAGHFGGESIELVYHRVDGFLQLQDLAFHIDR